MCLYIYVFVFTNVFIITLTIVVYLSKKLYVFLFFTICLCPIHDLVIVGVVCVPLRRSSSVTGSSLITSCQSGSTRRGCGNLSLFLGGGGGGMRPLHCIWSGAVYICILSTNFIISKRKSFSSMNFKCKVLFDFRHQN